MTDTQILTVFLAALPTTIAVMIGILMNNARLSDTNRQIAELRAEITRRFDESRDLWRSGLRRVEEVLDARLKHIEESR